MKRLLITLSFLTLLTCVPATSLAFDGINRGVSGSWYYPEQSGHGFAIEVLKNNDFIAYWYVYDQFGFPMWLIGQGEFEGSTAEVTFRFLAGMTFDNLDPANREIFEWGTGSFVFDSCDSGEFSFQSEFDFGPGFEFDHEGSIPLVRLAYIDGIDCDLTDPDPILVPVPVPEHIVSKVLGNFNGWGSNTVIQLLNGQVWQQTDFTFETFFSFQPDVVIFPDPIFVGKYVAQVEGSRNWIQVERVQ